MNAAQIAQKIYQHAVSMPSEIAFSLKSEFMPVPTETGSLQEPTVFSEAADAFTRDAALALRQEGCFVTSLDALDLPLTAPMLAEAHRLFAVLRERREHPAFRDRHTLTATREDLAGRDAIFHWGLSERILAVVSAYLGTAPAYDAFSAYFSPCDGREAGPRLWHRDKEDLRMVKVALYLSDVDADSGPYEIVRPAYTRQIHPKLYANMTDAQMLALLAPAEPSGFSRPCLGPAGTVIFTDTAAHYHRGRPPTARDRSAIFFSYFPLRPRYPFFCERSPYSRRQLEALAEGLPRAKRRSVLWRQHLPFYDKLIPRNRVTV